MGELATTVAIGLGVGGWVGVILVIAPEVRRLRRRVAHLEEASRWRCVIESGESPLLIDETGWHRFIVRAYALGAGLDVLELYERQSGQTAYFPQTGA